MIFVSVNNDNIDLLESFVANMGESAVHFRYFEKRSIDIINHHVITLLLMDNNIPIAYGHLENENNIVWLGICVLPQFTYKGFGKLMMTKLMEEAKDLKVTSIQLTVDKMNKSAIKMYENFNFKKVSSSATFHTFIYKQSFK